MAIDPRIALGVQPVQPINMLGMATQGMALQAAAQEMESNQGVREAIAGGMSPTDPRLLQYGKQGRETFKTGIEARVKQIETAQKRMDAVGGAFGYLKENPGAFGDVMRNLVQSGLYTQEQAEEAFARTKGNPAEVVRYADMNWNMAQKAKDQIKKIIEQDMGGYQQVTAVDPMSLKTTVVSRTGKTLTPGQALEQSQWAQVMGGGGGAGFGAGAPVGGGATPAGAVPARTNALMPGAEGADTTTVSDAGGSRNVLQQISAIDAEVARLSNIPGKPAAERIQSLLGIKKSLIDARQFELGTPRTGVIKDPMTGRMINVEGRIDPVTGQFTPIEAKPPGATVGPDGTATNVVRAPGGAPIAVVDEKTGKPKLVSPEEATGMRPATARYEQAEEMRAQMSKDIDRAISNLADVTKDGGLIDKSTGSGLGRMVDIGAGFVGKAPEGAIAAARIAPIADLVLKMVPRFEGPQSDKDTQSYREAAGQLADATLPREIRKQAGREILRLMKERKGQFVTQDMAGQGIGAGTGGGNVIDFGSLK